jgi:hypothetical protein
MNKFDLLKVYNFDNKIRLGENSDGGYVLGELDGEYDCYISAGVSNEESFSRDFIIKYNMNKSNSFAFDGTIENYPYHYTSEITYIKKNIHAINTDLYTNLYFLTKQYNDIFLKMDIEGGEYPWLLSINEDQLKKMKQIVIEFHGINDDHWGTNNKDKLKCLENLENTHYLIHAHGNNYSEVTDNIPDVIELTYVNKSYFVNAPELNNQCLPTPNLDFPNYQEREDYDLNFFPFRKVD